MSDPNINEVRARLEQLVSEREHGAKREARRGAITQQDFDRAYVDDMEHATVGGVRAADLRLLLDDFTGLKIFRDFVMRHVSRGDLSMAELQSIVLNHPVAKEHDISEYVPVAVYYPGGDYIEYAESDVPAVEREVAPGVAWLLDMQSRSRRLGFRLYNPRKIMEASDGPTS